MVFTIGDTYEGNVLILSQSSEEVTGSHTFKHIF